MPAPTSIHLHGVLMQIMGVGVLIGGVSGIGKSELALDLITRGHSLIADDAPLFTQTVQGHIMGSCPPLLRNYLHLHSLGLLDIAALYGEQLIQTATRLELVVTLQTGSLPASDRFEPVPSIHTRRVFDQSISEVYLDAASPRLAMLVECLVRRQLFESASQCIEANFAARLQQQLHCVTP